MPPSIASTRRPIAWIALLAALLLAALSPLSPVPPRPVSAQATFDPDLAQRATVQITQVFTNALGQTVISCIGSGTLVSADGLILTNAHVALPIAGCRSDRIMVALTVRLGEAPIPKYYARALASNIGWDLAVLQITTTLDDRPVDRAALALPFVELGRSEDVLLDETIEIVGYAAPERDETANSIARVVRGTVSGFTAEARLGDKAWLKTRAALPGTMTGGGAYDARGRLIGIPTVEPASSGVLAAGDAGFACRRIQDSNGDGRVDDQDLCVPVSGLINAMRPSRLARGLILAAQLGIAPEFQATGEAPAGPPGPPRFSRLFFAPSVDLAGMPTTVISRAPAGVSRLYLFFDYENMIDGLIYELRVFRDGVLDPTFSLAPATWSGGQRGLWYIGSTAQVWPNGNYEFTLFIEGVRAATANITVGGAAQPEPEMANILFGVPNPEAQLENTGNILPVGNVLTAQFVYNNMADGLAWRQVWYYEELRIAEATEVWDRGVNGTRAVSASALPEQPFQPGRYRLELYIGERLAATSDVIMAGGQVGLSAEIFSNLIFASELTEGRPGGVVGATFPNDITSLYAVYDWRDLAPGTPVTWRWTVDNTPLFEIARPWANAVTGGGAWVRLRAAGRIADGSYRLDLMVAGVVKLSATARVGLGQLPVTVFAAAEGVQVQGVILDAETGRGIVGAAFIVLKPEFDVRDFTWQMIEVLDIAYTDSNGRFALSRRLPRKKTYSALVVAQGYLSTSTDGLTIAQDERGPIELVVELNRD